MGREAGARKILPSPPLLGMCLWRSVHKSSGDLIFASPPAHSPQLEKSQAACARTRSFIHVPRTVGAETELEAPAAGSSEWARFPRAEEMGFPGVGGTGPGPVLSIVGRWAELASTRLSRQPWGPRTLVLFTRLALEDLSLGEPERLR